MQTLDAVLAFAVTMLILSMVVTTLVESLHRGLRLREKGLELLLGRFYDLVIARRNLGPYDAGMRTAFIQAMTANRAPTGATPLRGIWAGRRLDELGVQPFMERLGGMPYGANLVNAAAAEGEQALAAALKDVSQKFEAFGREASTYFEARARLVSVVLAMPIAFLANVNAFTLFTTFMRSPDVTQQVIALEKQATNEFRNYAEGLEARRKATGAGADRKSAEELGSAVQEAKTKYESTVKQLKGVGVPIGWEEGKFLSSIAAAFGSAYDFFGLVLGGLLVGLGAPFWYRAVNGLMSIRSMLRGRGTGAEKDAVPVASREERAAAQPQTPIDAFKAARDAANINAPLRPPEDPVG